MPSGCRRLPARNVGFAPAAAHAACPSVRGTWCEEVFGPRPLRQWALSFPYPLRFLFASKPEAVGPVLGIVHRVNSEWLADQLASSGAQRSAAR